MSVCLITSDSGPRIAALLSLLRPLTDEIVVAADSRVDNERLHHYAAFADKLYRVEFDYIERHLGWLHAQCSGDWILRLDGDEVPSVELLRELPELVRSTSVEQYMFPRRWLYPDAGHWLDEAPWWPDYQIRLQHNRGLMRFEGVLHSSAVPVRPCHYLEAPLYHLDLLDTWEEGRRTKGEHYERQRPGFPTVGGGLVNERFYLPELHAALPPQGVPKEDRDLVAAIIAGQQIVIEASALDLPVVAVAEMDRHWAMRAVAESAYEASIEAVERNLRMERGERREIHFRVENHGTETWPWDAEVGPRITLSYHLYSGNQLAAEGPRSQFPSEVGSGEAVVVPLLVIAPNAVGTYRLEVDVVHDEVRWFHCALSVDLKVEPGNGG